MTNRKGQHPVELAGEVRAVALNDGDGGGTCKLRLENGDTVSVHFVAEQETAIIGALRLRRGSRFKIAGLGDFSPTGHLKRVLRIDSHSLEWEPVPEDPDEPLLDRLLEIANSIPDEELAKIPTDFSANFKHYVYGWPKREEEE